MHRDAVAQVSCGRVATSQWAVIVDPEARTEQADGDVGEIWLHGLNIGKGYWNKVEETEATFHNKLADRLASGSHADGVGPDANWMATGDYGVWLDGELYITGRVKDLVIVDGRNHYPQDLEFSAQESCTALRPGFVAAFSVAANELPAEVFENAASGLSHDPDDASEQLVVVGERGSGKRVDPQEVADTVRAAIAARHGVMVRDVLLVPAGSIPGPPVARSPAARKAAYIDGTLRGGYQQTAFPDAPDQ